MRLSTSLFLRELTISFSRITHSRQLGSVVGDRQQLSHRSADQLAPCGDTIRSFLHFIKSIFVEVGLLNKFCLLRYSTTVVCYRVFRDQKLMWMAFGGHSIRRRSRVTSESDLNSLWLLNETPFCGSVLGSVHSEYTHWPAAVQLGYDRLHFGNTFSANYFSNSESRHYGDELLLYNYTPPYDVYYFDSGSESQIRCPTPDYSPSESPSQECSRLSVDSLYGGTCRVNSGRADEVETDSGSSGYASSSLSQKWEHCPPPVNKCAHRKRCCCCSDCTHLNVASDQQQSQIDTRRSYSRQEPIPPIHSDERNSRVKAVTFSEPLSTDVHPSVESSSSANDGSFRRRATQILSPARKWLSLPLRIEHTSLIGQLPELQHRVKATLEAIMSHEISSELWKAARGSSSSSTPVKSGGVTVSNSVTVGGLLHSSSEVDVSSKRSSMMSAVFDGESSKTDVRKRPPLPPNPPSRYRILKYSNVSAQRVSGESSSVCSSSNDERVLEGKLQGLFLISSMLSSFDSSVCLSVCCIVFTKCLEVFLKRLGVHFSYIVFYNNFTENCKAN